MMNPELLIQEAATDLGAAPGQAAPRTAALRAVERAIGDLRRGEPVMLQGPNGAALVLAVEPAREDSLARAAELGTGTPCLMLTGRRAGALGLTPTPDAGAVALAVDGLNLTDLIDLADPARGARWHGPLALAAVPALGASAVNIVKLARLLPAALVISLAAPARPEGVSVGSWAAWAMAQDVLAVAVADIAEYSLAASGLLTRVAEARLPLAGAEDARVVAFRPGDGGKAHLAIIIGAPKPDDSVLVRVHSECFTGDLLGSLRCDCGDQLRGAIEAIAQAGSGVLLYLSQEGRGIGLVNKLRAYQVQDGGADTAQANEALGFDADERIYQPAAVMLQQLDLCRVRLLTNNPQKVAALTRCGIDVTERVPHAFPANDHNEFYLATKAARFGHQF